MKAKQNRNGKRNNSVRSGRKTFRKGKLEPLQIREDAAGIDIGSEELFVAVAPGKDLEPVRRFHSFGFRFFRFWKSVTSRCVW